MRAILSLLKNIKEKQTMENKNIIQTNFIIANRNIINLSRKYRQQEIEDLNN